MSARANPAPSFALVCRPPVTANWLAFTTHRIWLPTPIHLHLWLRASAGASVGPADVRVYPGLTGRAGCKLDTTGQNLLKAAMAQLQLSARAFHRTRSVKLARTIADLAGVDNISPAYLAEAIQYRPRRQE